MKRYRVLLFDLFNTVALWHPERMPQFTWAGKSGPSSLGELEKILLERLPELPFAEFHNAFTAANEELAAERARDLKEIPSRERFSRALIKAGQPASAATAELAEVLSLRHMEILASACAIPAAHIGILQQLTPHYPAALVSNFDHGPTAHAILARDGVAQLFQHIVVSDGHGWRKTHRRIFDDTLKLLGASAHEALFIGDSLEDDVIGAQTAGLDVAWINARSTDLPAGTPAPNYTLHAITELDALLL